MYCKKCQNVINDNEYYCPYCGFNNKKENVNNNEEKVTLKKCFLNFFIKAFSGKGVATLKEFWVIFGIYLVINVVLEIFKLRTVNAAINIIFFFPLLALTIRRYHDIDRSGLFSLFFVYGVIAYFFSYYVENDNGRLVILISAIAALLINFTLLAMRSIETSRWNPKNGYLE